MGTKFTVYDHGVNPVKAQSLVEKAHTRQELAAICYVSTVSPFCPFLCARLPRKHSLQNRAAASLLHLTLEPSDQFLPDKTRGRDLTDKFLQV